MKPFTYDALPGRVVFGAGRRRELPGEVERLGCSRLMVIADENAKSTADELADLLGGRVACRWHEVAQHVPTELAASARGAARDEGIDGIVTIGGGSTTGLGKAVALVQGAPIVAVPTTYAGSEMTPIYGITGTHKETGRDVRVLPRCVVYDAELTVGLPMEVTTTSAFNALAHCIEALYGPDANPIISALAREGIAAISTALPALDSDPRDGAARSDLLYGAYLAGASLAVVGMALHHKLCHVLGGTFGLVHGEVNAVVLPHVVAFNEPAAPDAMAAVANALGADDAATALHELATRVGAPTSLSDLGMPRDGLDAAAERTVIEATFNPAPVDVQSIRALLDDAFEGRRPRSTSARSR